MDHKLSSTIAVIFLICAVCWSAIGAVSTALAQDDGTDQALAAEQKGSVQELTGLIRTGDFFYYLLPGRRAGETIQIYAEGTSGNLDPILGLLAPANDPSVMEARLRTVQQEAIDRGEDPLLALNAARDEVFAAWDDDGGEGLAASLAFTVPVDGDYRLVLANTLANIGRAGFGDYRLLLGVDAPQVLTGDAEPTGAIIAQLDQALSPAKVAGQEILGTLPPDRFVQSYELQDMQPGDTFSARIEAVSGDLRPALILRNYADKSVRTANLSGQESSAFLTYTLEEAGSNFQFDVKGCCEDAPTSGDYRLLLGINAPGVIDGIVPATDRTVVETATPVAIGVKLQQVVDVNQASEFFTVVADIQMEWTDPALAFNPDECQCLFQSYTGPGFADFLQIVDGRWPDFTLFNQQGNRWTQNKLAVIRNDGHAIYFERFTTNLQVDFDFTQYPFDSQTFPLIVDSIYPETFYDFTELADYNGISPDHGEDEFMITGFETAISSEPTSSRGNTSRFRFSYTAPRHLMYYMLQIFVPILLIIIVSWVTFFLKDYGRRIEVASANLLLFIAFSFSLSGNYPRLGYVTFLDAIMATIFVVNALVVIYNVWLKRLEMRGEIEQAERVDRFLDWAYPVAYVIGGISLVLIFF